MDSDDAMDNGEGASFDGQGHDPSSGKATLKRLVAAARLRGNFCWGPLQVETLVWRVGGDELCNAAKPACATCVRLKKECVYETGKSTSRIAQLKARIAELEGQLATRPVNNADAGSNGQGRHASTSSAASSETAFQPQQSVNGVSTNAAQPVPPPGQTVNPSSLSFAIPTIHGVVHQMPVHEHGTPSLSGATSTPGPNPSQPLSPLSTHGVMPGTEGNRSGSIPYPQSTGPRPLGQPNPNFDFDLSFLDQPMTDLNASLFGASMTPMHMGAPPIETPTDTASKQGNQSGVTDAVMEYHDHIGFMNGPGEHRGSRVSQDVKNLRDSHGEIFELVGLEQLHPTSGPSRISRVDDAMDDSFGLPQWDLEILPQLPQGRELVGGWFDPNDVPSAVRDHLLDLFFSRQNVGDLFHIVFHLPRLYTRLTQVPSKRPHPALMYAMYTTAARLSSQPAIKQLEGQFYSIAEKQIRVAIKAHDRLLDAVRAMALLVSYLFSKEQYSLGYHMTGTAVRLAISCGLDRIPTSVWEPPPPFNAAIHCTLRTGGYAIGPPEDAIDLAERIYAFWAVYEVDLCTAVAYLWHTGLPIEDIRTPLPRPMIEYEIGIVSSKDDVPISSVFEATPPPFPADSSFLVLRIKALTFLARVLKLRQEKNEVNPPVEKHEAAAAHVCSYPGSVHPAYVTHPTGFARVKNGLDHFVETLPAEHKPPWKWDEGEDVTLPRVQLARETSVLHFLTGNSYMQLWNVRALDAENTVAILIARRLVNVMYMFQTEPMSSGYDIFIITIWNEVAMVLVREAKRLQFLGETARAAAIDADLGVAIAALKKWGDVDVANEHDGADIAAINGKMLDQLRAMGQEDWAEAVAESQRRFGGGSGGLGTSPCLAPSGAAFGSHR